MVAGRSSIAAKAAAAQQLAAEYPENKTRPVEAQGGLVRQLWPHHHAR
jgi:hypothetical protein